MASEGAKAQGTFAIERWLGPVNPTQSQINMLMTAEMSGSTSASSAWTFVPGTSGTIPITEIFSDNSGNGDAMYYTLSVTCPNGTTLGQTEVEYSSALGEYNVTLDQALVSFSDYGVGVTQSGQQLWYGNSDTAVTEFYMLGAGSTLDIGNMTTQEALNFWGPFHEAVTYSGNWGTIPGSTDYSNPTAVPEPDTNCLFLIGIALTGASRIYWKLRSR